jgi:hexosaminidase
MTTADPQIELDDLGLVPKPAKLERRDGWFEPGAATKVQIRGTSDARLPAADLAELLPGAAIARGEDAPAADPALGDEGYELDLTPTGASLRANTARGLLYAVQTLRQLLGNGADRVRCVRIIDRPRFAWRGLLVDPARHFLDVPFMKRYIDLLAYHKLNVFHLHLTDGQGWRLQIDKYPKLTEVGAARDATRGERPPAFYTKADVREILAHAKRRQVTVIPEIEMPGHCGAAIASYPELKCPTAGDDMWQWAFCAGEDNTFTFLETVLDETIALFPDTPYIHVGGDERPGGTWAKCPKCTARMRDQNLPDEHALQTWFMHRIAAFVASRDRRAVAWEVTRTDAENPSDMDDLGNGAIVHNWHGGTAFAARHGWDVINSTCERVYFDYPQFPEHVKDRPSWMRLLTLETAYGFDPVPAGLDAAQAKHVLGSVACAWGEWITQDNIDPMLFPRLTAFAETVWSPREGRSFDSFERRLAPHRARLERTGVRFANPAMTL